MKKHKNKIIIGAVTVAVLALAFFFGGNNTNTNEQNIENRVNPDIKQGRAEERLKKQEDKSGEKSPQKSGNQAKTEQKEEIVSEDKPAPVEPENAVVSDEELVCTLSVRCDTILKNMESLDEEKHELVPSDGIIYPEQKVTFYEGESVFNVLMREMKLSKIHLEFENTPIYNSAYIEGIGNLYEFDCGELSGWMYKVNGWFPNYGCSRYQLKNGDKIEWVYTCDLGADVGGSNMARNGM